MKTKTRIAFASAAIIAAPLTLSACSHATPSIGQCAIVTGRGVGDRQDIKHVVHPGIKVTKGSHERAWYFPCNVRNYVTGKDGDRGVSQAVKTATGKGSAPGMPVYVYSRLTWQLNQDDKALRAWFPFCLKYGCATNKSQDSSSNAALTRSSDPGWNAMLAENVGPALDLATRMALADPALAAKFGPGLWQDQAAWPELEKAIQSHLAAALAQTSGLSTQWLCAPTTNDKVCAVPPVHITDIEPTSGQIKTQYEQQVAAENAAAVNEARLSAARKLYGDQAPYWLGLQDSMQKCADQGKTCTFYVGNPPTAGR